MGRKFFCGTYAEDAQGGASERDDYEPGSRRNFRYAAATGAIWTGRGGAAGSGEQFVSWIHQRKILRAPWSFWRRTTRLMGRWTWLRRSRFRIAELMRMLREAWGAQDWAARDLMDA